MKNINTKAYWEKRFQNDWEKRNGRKQTENFAKSQSKYFKFDSSFNGVILDFGCGLGDAMPVYKEFFPKAKLIGIDISTIAIAKCKEKYGDIAEFLAGDITIIPEVDIIIASNVLEHLDNDIEIAKKLLKNCNQLYVTVPYKEHPLSTEHINYYDEDYFSMIGSSESRIFYSAGWTEYGARLIKLRIMNLLRLFFRQPLKKRSQQIMFYFSKKA